MKQIRLGDMAQIIGMGKASIVCGEWLRDGSYCYSLAGINGFWPSWLVVAVRGGW